MLFKLNCVFSLCLWLYMSIFMYSTLLWWIHVYSVWIYWCIFIPHFRNVLILCILKIMMIDWIILIHVLIYIYIVHVYLAIIFNYTLLNITPIFMIVHSDLQMCVFPSQFLRLYWCSFAGDIFPSAGLCNFLLHILVSWLCAKSDIVLSNFILSFSCH